VTVKELIEDLRVFDDIGYGWMEVVCQNMIPVEVRICSGDYPALVIEIAGHPVEAKA